MDDPFIQSYDASELEIAAEFLTTWLPFLTRDLCSSCSSDLRRRVQSLPRRPPDSVADTRDATEPPEVIAYDEPYSIEPTGWGSDSGTESPKPRALWADMAQEDELEEENADVTKKAEEQEGEEEEKAPVQWTDGREMIRLRNVRRKKDFICLERVEGKIVNVLDGLELHTGVFSAAEQKRIVDFIYELQEKGRSHKLGEHTYLEQQIWTWGKGPVTIQFGCCYNFSMDENGISSSILQDVAADPIPHMFKDIIRRLVQWHVLPLSCIPDSCVVNIYEAGDSIPPHIESHDFTRPFCTVSLLSQYSILFGAKLTISGDWQSGGSTAIPLPLGSVLVINGNGANVAKHCVHASPAKRISITFRRMDEGKRPVGFNPEPDLQKIQPLPSNSGANQSNHREWRRQPMAESRMWKKDKGSPRREVGLRTAYDFQDSQPSLHDPDILPERLTHRSLDRRHTVTRDNSREGKESANLAYEFKHRPDLPYVQPHTDNRGTPARSSPYTGTQWRTYEESCSLEDSKQHNGERLVHFDKNRIVISRILEPEEDEPQFTRAQSSTPAHASQIRVQSRNGGLQSRNGGRTRVVTNFH